MKHDMEKVAELHLRSQTLEATVDLLNTFGDYLRSHDNSAEEDQFEASVDEKVSDLMKGGNQGVGGHVLLCLIAIIHNCSDPEAVQEFLDGQSDRMIREAGELGAEE